MPILVDQQMRERISHETDVFPISYFERELAELPDREGPLHWHPEFEFARAETGTLEYRVGQAHVVLNPGDLLFINGNLLHSVRQISGGGPDLLPAVVFSGSVIAPETSIVYRKYIAPIVDCPSLPFVVFRRGDDAFREVHELADEMFASLRQRTVCCELIAQRSLNRLFESLYLHFDTLPKSPATRIQLRTQVRVQKMLSYLYEHYAEPVTAADIAAAASVSRSEAARCFHEYMGCSPVDALIRYRLQTAHRMLRDTSRTVQDIGLACGFQSPGYFSRQFRKLYGYTPGHVRSLGK